MSNTFITPLSVAKVAIITLLNNLCFAGLVYRDYSTEYRKVGSTVRIRKPATLTAIEFDGDLTGEYQAVTEGYVDVVMNKLLVVPVKVTAQEMTLDIASFNTQIVEPAMQALAQKVDLELAKMYKDVPYYFDSTTPVIADLLGARKIQNDLKVPFGQTRYAVMSPMTAAALLGLSEMRDLEKCGETKPLREAAIGRRFGYEYYENQNVQHHVIGTTDEAGEIDGGNVVAGSTTIHVDGLGTGTINKGTILTIENNTGVYVVTEDATIATAECDVKIYPGLNALIVDGDDVTLHGDDAVTTSRENLMFHKNAFGFVSAPMADPIGGAKGAHATYKGLTVNTVYGYDMDTFNNIITFSILCGFKTLTPELAVRFYDAA